MKINSYWHVLILALLAFALGCPAPKGGGEAGKTDLGDRLSEDVYRFPLPSNPMTLDPAHTTDTVSDSVTRRIFDTLVRFDPDGNVVPNIAKKWEASEDGKAWKFYLNEGVTFHNGRKLTAADFVYSLSRLLDPSVQSERAGLLFPVKGARQFYFTPRFAETVDFLKKNPGDTPDFHESLANLADNIEYVSFSDETDIEKTAQLLSAAAKSNATSLSAELSGELSKLAGRTEPPETVSGITAYDDLTLKIELDEGYAPFLMVLGMTNCAVVPKEEVDKYGESFEIHPVGTGSFVFQDWKPDISITLAANRAHFARVPGVDKIVYRIITDDNTRFEEFKNGQIEHTDIPAGRMEEVRKDPSLSKMMVSKPAMDMYGYCFNTSKPPFKGNKLLRKAINHAIDKDDIIDTILEGKYKRMDTYVPEGTFYFRSDSTGYPYDPELAKKLLAEAGYPDGKGLPTITLNIDNQEYRNKIAVAVQSDLREIGVNVEISRKDWGTFLNQIYDGDFEFCQNTWLTDYPDPDNWLFTLLDSSQAGAPGNISRYSNPEFDKLVREAQMTVDAGKRMELYGKAEEMAMEDAPWVLMFVNSPTMLVQPYVENFRLTVMDRAPQLTNCPIEEVKFSKSE